MALHRTPVRRQRRARLGEEFDRRWKRMRRSAIGNISFNDVLAIIASHIKNIAICRAYRRQQRGVLERNESVRADSSRIGIRHQSGRREQGFLPLESARRPSRDVLRQAIHWSSQEYFHHHARPPDGPAYHE